MENQDIFNATPHCSGIILLALIVQIHISRPEEESQLRGLCWQRFIVYYGYWEWNPGPIDSRLLRYHRTIVMALLTWSQAVYYDIL